MIPLPQRDSFRRLLSLWDQAYQAQDWPRCERCRRIHDRVWRRAYPTIQERRQRKRRRKKIIGLH